MRKFMVGGIRFLPLCAVLLVLPAIAADFPIAKSGTEGLEVTVSSTNPVIATYQGNSAVYSNDLYLMLDASGKPGDDGNLANDLFIFNNHKAVAGNTKNLGSFPVGTKLIFRLHVNDTGRDYFTGAASRNPDNKTHARAQADWKLNETLVSFEDLFDGPFDYNDLSFSFVPTTATAQFLLTVTKAGSGTVTSNPAGINCGSTCSVTFAQSTSVILTATAASGSSFTSWSGACTGTGSCTVSMTQARNVTATFQAIAQIPSIGWYRNSEPVKIYEGPQK